MALNFSENEKSAIEKVQTLLKKESSAGNFTRRENLHLTLAFLGEVPPDRIPKLRQILTKTAERSEAFSLTYDRLGFFPGKGREQLWYLTCETVPGLTALEDRLRGSLQKAGYSPEDREFLPHVTLGRRCVFDTVPSIEFSPIRTHCPELKLMLSEQIDGVLTYTTIFSAKLNGHS